MSHSPRHPLASLSLIAVLAGSSLLLAPSASAYLVVNGGFEDGATTVFATGGVAAGGGDAAWIEGSLAGWDVGPLDNSPNVLATNQEAYFDKDTGGLFSGAHTGALAAVFPNTPSFNGYMSQAIAGVIAGQSYQISFWLSNQIGDASLNYMDVKWGGTVANSFTDGVSLTGGTPPIPGAIPVPTEWTYYSFNVTATENNQHLTFIGGNASAGNLIDDVVVVPEVSSFGVVMGLGLFALGTTARFRRRVRVTV